ncbi:MAG: hypothetical protein WD690_13140 [Vicinamibacterales bacterium]
MPGASDRPPEIPQFRLPAKSGTGPVSPYIYGSARLYFGESRQSQDAARQVNAIIPIEPGLRSVDWDRAEIVAVRPGDLQPVAAGGAPAPLPALVTDVQRFSRVARDFYRWLGRAQRADAFRYPPLKMSSKPGETEDLFLQRVRQSLQKKRDLLAERLRRKRKSKQSLTQTEAELQALPEMSEISAAALERIAMRPRRGGTTVDLVAVVWK